MSTLSPACLRQQLTLHGSLGYQWVSAYPLSSGVCQASGWTFGRIALHHPVSSGRAEHWVSKPGLLNGVVEGVARSLTHMFFSLALSACWRAEEEIGIS
jgi:hypothetical protein